MKKKKNKKEEQFDLFSNKVLIIFGIFVCICSISIGYSAFTANLYVAGEAVAHGGSKIYVSNFGVSMANSEAIETYNSEYTKDSTTMHTTLPNADSYLIYEATITNDSSDNYVLSDISSTLDNNSEIGYEVLDMLEGDVIAAGDSDTLRIKVYNTSGAVASVTTDDLGLEYTFTKYTPLDTTTISGYIQNNYNVSNKSQVAYNSSSTDANMTLKGRYNSSLSLLEDVGGNLRYYGANPNNYIYFNCFDYSDKSTCEVWRILGVFDGKLKLVRNDSIGDYAYDDSASSINLGMGVNEYGQSNIAEMLNLLYYYADSGECIEQNDTVVSCDFSSKGLKNSATRNLVANATWNLGTCSSASVYVNEFYQCERGTNGASAVSGITRYNTWTGKVAVPYSTDYAYAADLSQCNTTLNSISSSTCKNSNWLSSKMVNGSITSLKNTAFLTAVTGQSVQVYHLPYTGYVSAGTVTVVSSSFMTFPTLYLSEDTLIGGGTGSSSNPYYLNISQPKHTFTINPTPSDATVKICNLNTGSCVEGTGSKSVSVVEGTNLSYKVSKSGYVVKEGTYKMGNSNKTENITLNVSTVIKQRYIKYVLQQHYTGSHEQALLTTYSRHRNGLAEVIMTSSGQFVWSDVEAKIVNKNTISNDKYFQANPDGLSYGRFANYTPSTNTDYVCIVTNVDGIYFDWTVYKPVASNVDFDSKITNTEGHYNSTYGGWLFYVGEVEV